MKIPLTEYKEKPAMENDQDSYTFSTGDMGRKGGEMEQFAQTEDRYRAVELSIISSLSFMKPVFRRLWVRHDTIVEQLYAPFAAAVTIG